MDKTEFEGDVVEEIKRLVHESVAVTVNDCERRTIAVRVTRLVPVSKGTDHIFLLYTLSG